MKCSLCGKSVEGGILKTKHDECERSINSFIDEIMKVIERVGTKDVTDGKMRIQSACPEHIVNHLLRDIHVNFSKNEVVLWVFKYAEYFEMKNNREFVRTGTSWRRYPQYSLGISKVDDGTICLTTKHLYFVGDSKTFRIQHAKLLSIERDTLNRLKGIKLQRDVQSAKYQYFMIDQKNAEVLYWLTYLYSTLP